MSRALQQQLLARLDAAVAALDLPLTREHLERLAVELTPDVAAMLGKTGTTVSRFASAANPVAEGLDGERHVREFAGCTLSIRSDVAEDAPAALLGLELQSQQPDILALDVTAATNLIVTVKPQSSSAWQWWQDQFDTVTCTPEQPCCTTMVGHHGDVTVELRGEGIPDLLANRSAAPLGSFMAGHPW